MARPSDTTCSELNNSPPACGGRKGGMRKSCGFIVVPEPPSENVNAETAKSLLKREMSRFNANLRIAI